MPRQIVIRRLCDLCYQYGTESESIASWTVSIVREGDRLDARALELCEEHSHIGEDFARIIAECAPAEAPTAATTGQAIPPRRGRPPAGAVLKGEPAECPVCLATLRGGSLLGHIWTHRPDGKPTNGTECPDCGDQFERPQGLGQHRAVIHGYLPMVEALSGVPGWDRRRAELWVAARNRRAA